jgi:hypothetical protein
MEDRVKQNILNNDDSVTYGLVKKVELNGKRELTPLAIEFLEDLAMRLSFEIDEITPIDSGSPGRFNPKFNAIWAALTTLAFSVGSAALALN